MPILVLEYDEGFTIPSGTIVTCDDGKQYKILRDCFVTGEGCALEEYNPPKRAVKKKHSGRKRSNG